jgi:hypothetical protein
MLNVESLHSRAMEFADDAAHAAKTGESERAAKLYQAAFEAEREAASLFAGSSSEEPTRSVLFRSAATLALDCGENREAERLACLGLSGGAPAEIADELRDVLERAQWEHHLSLRGVTLDPTEFQFTLDGDAVGLGIANADVVTRRVECAKKLVRRTGHRLQNLPFQDDLRAVSKKTGEDVEVFLSVPRAASFALTFRIGQQQLAFTSVERRQTVIDEMMSCMEILQGGGAAELAARIPDEAYRANFVALARQLQPDGTQVKLVGLTCLRDGVERRVQLSRQVPRSGDQPFERPMVSLDTGQAVTIVGRLKYADSMSKQEKIRLVDDDGKTSLIYVPKGMMADIVRPLWDDVVTVVAHRRGTRLTLSEIARRDE